MPEADFLVLVDGAQRDADALAKAPIVAMGTGLPDSANAAYGFKSKAAFETWAAETDHAERVAAGLEVVARRKKLANADHTVARRRQTARVKQIRAELRDLSQRTGLPIGSQELFLKATSEADPVEGAIFDPFILHDTSNFGGGFLPVFGGLPLGDFGWFGFDNRASSVTISGLGLITEHVWYVGRQFWMFGFPIAQFRFTWTGFDNSASAGIAT